MSSALEKDERRWTEWIVPLLVGLLATLKTLRLPNGWATTQSLVDYSQGFVKRGLLGAVYRLLHWTGYGALQRAMLGELLVMLVLLFALGVRSRVGRWCGNALVPAVFLGSYALSFLVHMVGYTDVLNTAICAGLLLVRRPGVRFLLAVPLCTAAVLMHENFLLTQFPVVLFSFVLEALAGQGNAARRGGWVRGGSLCALMVALTVLVSTEGLVTPEKAERLHQAALQHTDLDLHPFVFTVLSRDLAGNIALTAVARTEQWWVRANWVSFANIAPAALLLLRVGYRMLRAQAMARDTRVLLYAAGLVAAVCPLSIHLLGFDAPRWNCLCLLNVYLILCAMAQRLAPAATPAPLAERHLTVLVVAIGMISGYGLFDEEDINPYPFAPVLLQHWQEYQYGVAQERRMASGR